MGRPIFCEAVGVRWMDPTLFGVSKLKTLLRSLSSLGHRPRSQGINYEFDQSNRRVADHGEVFTPQWLVENMPDLVKGETERIDSRLVVAVLQRKPAAVNSMFGKSDFERRHYGLSTVMYTYRIELAATYIILSQNLVHGDALTMRMHDGQSVTFAELATSARGSSRGATSSWRVVRKCRLPSGRLIVRPSGQACRSSILFRCCAI